MPGLTQQRCFNHLLREAVARCPECRQYYCRECVTEHDDRVICAACLKKSASPETSARRGWRVVGRLILFFAGCLAVWMFFYFFGQTLLSLPNKFHDLTIWKGTFQDHE